MSPTYEDLIRWLALPLEGRTPIFEGVDASGVPTPRDDMAALFREIMGEPTDPPMPGRWEQCPCCLNWSVNSLTSG